MFSGYDWLVTALPVGLSGRVSLHSVCFSNPFATTAQGADTVGLSSVGRHPPVGPSCALPCQCRTCTCVRTTAQIGQKHHPNNFLWLQSYGNPKVGTYRPRPETATLNPCFTSSGSQSRMAILRAFVHSFRSKLVWAIKWQIPG